MEKPPDAAVKSPMKKTLPQMFGLQIQMKEQSPWKKKTPTSKKEREDDEEEMIRLRAEFDEEQVTKEMVLERNHGNKRCKKATLCRSACRNPLVKSNRLGW